MNINKAFNLINVSTVVLNCVDMYYKIYFIKYSRKTYRLLKYVPMHVMLMKMCDRDE